MSDFFLCEIEELEKQGVKVIKIEKEYRKNGENYTTIEVTRELDFTEHDKVFEDEIARLKAKIAIKDMDYKTASELLGEYQQENESLKQRIAELENSETENTVEVKVLATPIEIATYLINNTCTINELKMIAEHINVYCNGGK